MSRVDEEAEYKEDKDSGVNFSRKFGKKGKVENFSGC